MRHTWIALLALACGGSHRYGDATYIPRKEIDLAGRSLSKREAKLVDEHGFAITAQDAASFHVGYTALFHRHQPVYITADSLLYAWHSSYDAILMELEVTSLVPAVHALLVELRGKLADASADAQTKADLDAYLAVALSFLDAKQAAPVAGGDPATIGAMIAQGTAASDGGADLAVFGAHRKFDFTMLKPRGHYTHLPELEGYFRAMSWLGRVEIEIAYKRQPAAPWTVDRRALRAAVLLGTLIDGPARAKWDTIDHAVGAFVGPPDSMSVPGLATALATLHGNVDAPDADVVAAFRAPTAQRIRTQLAQPGAESLAFVTLGQRFVYDSKLFSDLTAGSLASEPPRMMPSPLDVAHAVLHNPAARPLLAKDLATFGAAYGKALDAAAADQPDPALWDGSLYHGWLRALAELSPDPARDRSLPAPLGTDAWARRMMNAQLASWAELRHDNLLYAKQSFTAELLCAYPDAYVDPYPGFYAAMAALAKRGRATVDALHAPNAARVGEYFDRLGATMAHLRAMAERERANEPLADADLDWVNHMVSIDGKSGGCTTTLVPQGWYADLFYDRSKVLWHEPVIADVHTQPTDEAGNSVGYVLHVGTMRPRMLVARLQHDGGKNAQTYRGFVSSYAETVTKNFERYTDEDWREKLGTIDATPAWLKSIVAP